MHLTTFHPTPPFVLHKLLDILSRFRHPNANRAHDGAYWRAFSSGDGTALIRAAQNGDQLDAHLMAHEGDIQPENLHHHISHVLNLEADRGAFFAFAREYPALWDVVAPLEGIPDLRTASVFEALAITIIEQQIAWINAQRGINWLLAWANRGIDYNGSTFYAFPTPQQIAAATLDSLKPLKITHRRIELLIHIAGRVSDGSLPLEELTEPQTAYDFLLDIKGIGHWTAAVTVSRAFGAYPHVAHNDVALQAAVNHYFYGESGRISGDAVQATFAPYGEFAGVAAHYTLLRWVLDRY